MAKKQIRILKISINGSNSLKNHYHLSIISKNIISAGKYHAGNSEAKKQEKPATAQEALTYQRLLLASINVGLTMSEFDELEIGELLDIIITYNNSNSKQKNSVRKATQKDFDNF
ncbi:hypothetical protein SD457_10870 [Coprobacillaceae bacterium CR2/5/TPMF4]|nr:hypothetical protein SD457_10870 [Coprobacillaceae bacterium CR2/5/TPMF4]